MVSHLSLVSCETPGNTGSRPQHRRQTAGDVQMWFIFYWTKRTCAFEGFVSQSEYERRSFSGCHMSQVMCWDRSLSPVDTAGGEDASVWCVDSKTNTGYLFRNASWPCSRWGCCSCQRAASGSRSPPSWVMTCPSLLCLLPFLLKKGEAPSNPIPDQFINVTVTCWTALTSAGLETH